MHENTSKVPNGADINYSDRALVAFDLFYRMAVQNTRGKIVFEAAQKRFLCAVSVNPKHAGEITASTQRNDAAKDLAVNFGT